MMQEVLTGLWQDCCLIYLDDIIVYSPYWETLLQQLDEVPEKLQTHQLTCTLNKCQFGREKVSFLGLNITPNGNLPQQQHLRAVEKLAEPRNKKELQSLLGTCN